MTALVATVEAGSFRVRLDVSSAPATVAVNRVDPDGQTRPVRNAEPVTTSGGTALLYDYEAPRDAPVVYRSGDGASSGTVTLSSNGLVRLVHPGQPSLSLTAHVESLRSKKRTIRTGVFAPPGRVEAVTVSAGLSPGWSGELVLATYNDDENDDMLAILDSGTPLFFAPPARMDEACYLSFTSVDEQRVSDYATEQGRRWVCDVQRVGRPPGVGASEWTWAGVLAKYPTWDALLADNATWLDVMDGPD